MERQQFTAEFKRGAVRLPECGDKPVTHLDVDDEGLDRAFAGFFLAEWFRAMASGIRLPFREVCL